MNRRFVAALTLGAAVLSAQPARAQGGTVDFSAYSAVFTDILSPIVLNLSVSGSVTLTASPDLSYGAGPSKIGKPAAAGPDYYFGSGLAYWRNNVGAYLNSDAGALRFTLDNFFANQVSAYINFNPLCFSGGSAPREGELEMPGAADDRPCMESGSFRAFDSNDNEVAGMVLTPIDASFGEDTGKQFTLTSLGTDIAYFELRGALIAATNVQIAPEPSTFVLAASGLMAMLGMINRRRR